jgi:UDP-GlcNAc:undecaprenyl-phosphate GlcNAc-1-phosphate transferase
VLLGSPDHFALRLRKWRLSTRQTVLLSYGAGALLGLCGLGLMLSQTAYLSAALLLAVILCGLIAGYYMKKIDMTM